MYDLMKEQEGAQYYKIYANCTGYWYQFQAGKNSVKRLKFLRIFGALLYGLINFLLVQVNEYRSTRRGCGNVNNRCCRNKSSYFCFAESIPIKKRSFLLPGCLWISCGEFCLRGRNRKISIFSTFFAFFILNGSLFIRKTGAVDELLSTDYGSYPQILPGYPQSYAFSSCQRSILPSTMSSRASRQARRAGISLLSKSSARTKA